MRLTSERIEGELVEIDVDGSGTFWAEFADVRHSGATLLELKEKLGREIKKAKETKPLEVTVVDLVPNVKKGGWENGAYRDGRGAVHALLRGKHKTQGQYLLRDLEGKAFQISTYSNGGHKILRRLSDEEIAEYARLAGEADGATKALEEWISARSANPEAFAK